MGSVRYYGAMIGDRGRIEAYAAALRARVTRGSVVIDLGTGTGILALLACQAGARKVYAIESEDIIETAREIVRDNGYADRVVLIHADAADVTLGEQADVLVAEIHGALPFYRKSPGAIFDVRDRLLRPGGAVIPMADTVMAAVVSAPASFARIVEPWEYAGIDGAAGRRRTLNECGREPDSSHAVPVVAPVPWTVIDYRLGTERDARGVVRWTIPAPCEAHGIYLWFDCETAPGFGFSNSPQSAERHTFGQMFFPWPAPCRLDPGDGVAVEVRADAVGGEYHWSWATTITSGGDGASVKASFQQTQFQGLPLSLDRLRKSSASFVPRPTAEARVDQLILNLLVEGTRLDAIAARVLERFPERFRDLQTALNRVIQLSVRYSD